MTTAQERRDNVETRVMRGAADEADHAGFDVGQQEVLLGFVKAMDLIDDQDGLTRRLATRVGEDFAQLRRARKHGVNADDERLGFGGDDLGQGGLAATGRTVEEQRAKVVSLDQARQQRLGSEQTGMANDLREVAGAHARSQRATARGDGIGHPLTKARQGVVRPKAPFSHDLLLFREGHQVAVGLLAPQLVILLVIFFRTPELGSGLDLGGDRAAEGLGEGQTHLHVFGDLLLLGRMREDNGAILVANVRTLAVDPA